MLNRVNMTKELKKAVFLDRDGTINEDPGYLNDPSQLKLLPQVGEALSLLQQAGYLLIVISNQSGVGRGLIKPETMPLIHQRLGEFLAPWGVKIDHYELCFHTPEQHCECRKPKPKLILDAARLLAIDVTQSYMVGDKISDLGAGIAAGCKGSLLVRTGAGEESVTHLKLGQATFVGDSLLNISKWIVEHD
jgi:D-glycero-D-manno-heptose 1,7-bisphosphate phosphatase